MAEVPATDEDTDTDTMEREHISPELVLIDPELARALRQSAPPTAFRVVFVCTGNRFRSVLAEATFRSVAVQLPVEVDSYGILDLGSSRPLPEATRAAEEYGLRISEHVARSLGTADLSGSSLVIGFEPQHVTAAIETAGAPADRAFLLPEIVDLLRQVGVDTRRNSIEHAVEIVTRAHELRLAERRWTGRSIHDPMGLSEEEQRRIGDSVHEQTSVLARELFGLV